MLSSFGIRVSPFVLWGKGGARIQTQLLCLQLWSVLGIVWSGLALGRTGKGCVFGREEDNLDRSLLQVFHLVGTALGGNWARNKHFGTHLWKRSVEGRQLALGYGVALEVAIDVEGEVADFKGCRLSSKGGGVLLAVLSYFTGTLPTQALPDL